MMQGRLVSFGEIMGRMATPGFCPFRQALPGKLDVSFAGAEANVAASVCNLGGSARFVASLPTNLLGDVCLSSLRHFGVNTDFVVRHPEGRLGLYFLESGANQRPSNVVYDRDGSSISMTPSKYYNWAEAMRDASWFHVTGITPAISALAAEAVLEAVQLAKQLGLTVSCDLNYRKKLWRWKPEVEPIQLAQQTMREILPHVDVVIANEEDSADVLGIHAADTDVDSGAVSATKYPAVAREIIQQFPNVSRVGITLRESLSASHNRWGAMLYDGPTDQACFAPLRDGEYRPYEITNIVDRVGAGDSFAAGVIFASSTPEFEDLQSIVSFATASSCLAHSIPGDMNYSTRAEVEALMRGSGSGRVNR
jgi:2-dehydro-3-deoxygluconokinase